MEKWTHSHSPKGNGCPACPPRVVRDRGRRTDQAQAYRSSRRGHQIPIPHAYLP